MAPLTSDWNRISGRPRQTWLWTVESDVAPLNIGLTAAYHRAQNRQACMEVAPLWVDVLPENVGQSSPKLFRGCYPVRPPIMPNFIEIGQTSLEKSVKKVLPFRSFTTFLSRTEMWLLESQRARGATKNWT